MRILLLCATTALVASAACGETTDAGFGRVDAAALDAGPILRTGRDATVLSEAAVASCGDFGRTAPCRACLKASCGTEATACARNASCADNAACVEACDAKVGDANKACLQACADQYFTLANPEYFALIECMGSPACLAVCPFAGP